MATYSTDLTTAALADSDVTESWTEFASANTGGTPADDDENFIQGVNCQSQTTGTKSGTSNPKSVVYQHGSDLSSGWTSGHAFFVWQFYAVGSNLYDYDQTTYSGLEIGISNDSTNVDRFFVGGANVRRNPYGGWDNVVVDPEQTADTTYGTGGAGYTYIGSIAYTINAISKGTPHAVDAIRYGRGEISVTGTGGSFSELASYNDYNAGGTPPGTSSTSVDSGRHRLGLFSDQNGTYLWKGMLAFGLTGSSVTFSDSNETILIDDCPKTYAAFNKIEVRNASSSVTLTNVTFTALGTLAKGNWENMADATVALDGCSFNGMGTFIFDSNTTIDGCIYNSCGLITTGNADIDSCVFNQGTGAVAVTTASPAEAANITNSEFISDGTGNGLEITGTAADLTLTGLIFTGYSTTVDANKAIYVNISTGTVNITISGGSGVTLSSHVRTAGATVNVISGAVTVQVKAALKAGTAVESARVFLKASDGTGPFPFEETVTSITRSTTTATVTHTAHGMASNDKIYLEGITDKTEDNWRVIQITVTGVNTYTFTTTDSGSTSYTGTIKSTFVALNGLTNASGILSTSRVYSSNQPVTGWTRKSTSSPLLQEGVLVGEVDSTNGFSGTAVMLSDE